MVYETDFYTTRRPYRATPSLSTYTITKREIPWEKVPFVPRPSLVADPVTAFGKRRVGKPKAIIEKVVITPMEKERIKPKVLLDPPKPYMSPRDITRQKVNSYITRGDKQSLLPKDDDVDVLLKAVHSRSAMFDLPYKRKLVLASYLV